jgi:hypothetical protein
MVEFGVFEGSLCDHLILWRLVLAVNNQFDVLLVQPLPPSNHLLLIRFLLMLLLL